MNKKRILVVDDDEISRFLIQGFLRDEKNYIVDTVEDGSDCLSFIQHNNVDLIISDVEMNNVDGLELSKTLLTNKETSEIPVILSSVRDQSEIKKKSRDYTNVKKVVQKPYDRNTLLSDLKKYF